MEVQRARLMPGGATGARFSALILSLHCTHPIQLGSVMGLLRRVKICSHFFFFPLLNATIRAAATWDETSSPLLFLSLSLFLKARFTLFFFLRLAVFHGVMILLLISPWLSSSFGRMWESKLCSACCFITLGMEVLTASREKLLSIRSLNTRGPSDCIEVNFKWKTGWD